jgi:hypothetical protein
MKDRPPVACLALSLGALCLSGGWAQARHRDIAHCLNQPVRFSLSKLLFGTKPQPNGCAPPVFQNGEYIGQDPDRNIRFQLFRDPDTGYTTRY